MKNPYLWQKSLRVGIFTGLFPVLIVKLAVFLLLIYVAADRGFNFDPAFGNVALLALLAMALSILLDLFTIYHLTTTWHRLNRHPWVIIPDAFVNLALAAASVVPLPFAAILAALQSLLGNTPAITWALWAPLGAAVILAFVQVVVSLRLAIRLRQQRLQRP